MNQSNKGQSKHDKGCPEENFILILTKCRGLTYVIQIQQWVYF